MKFPLTKLVEVIWTDITTFNTGWVQPEEAVAIAQPTYVKTVGYVLSDTADFLKLAMLQAQIEQNEVGVTATIPKGCIKKMKVLKGL